MMLPDSKMSPKPAILLLCLAALANAVPSRQPRIIGGETAKAGEYPYFASLYYKSSISYRPIVFCGGAILNNQWILTAGYCGATVMSATELIVKAGNVFYSKASETEQKSEVSKIIIHPNYSTFDGPNDIALLKLATPLKFNEFVAPIELSKEKTIPTGAGTIMGLGALQDLRAATFPEELQKVTLSIISNDKCKEIIVQNLGEADANEFNFVDEHRFCTGPTKKIQGYCLHDTGSPFVVNENGKTVIAGVATFGFAADCGKPNAPSIYTRVSEYNDWIQETISKN